MIVWLDPVRFREAMVLFGDIIPVSEGRSVDQLRPSLGQTTLWFEG